MCLTTYELIWATTSSHVWIDDPHRSLRFTYS